MDALLIEELKVHCTVGLLPLERTAPQEILFDAELFCDLDETSRTDVLGSTPDYHACCDEIAAHAAEAGYGTLEALARGCAERLLARWPAIEAVSMTVRKPSAHPDAKSCGVRLRIVRKNRAKDLD